MKLFTKNLLFPAFFLLAIVIAHLLSFYIDSFSSIFGLFPRKMSGLTGVFTAPFVHIDFSHFISNFLALVILLPILFTVFHKVSYFLFPFFYIIPGIFTWLIGKNSCHIGASGIVYALITFIVGIGFFSKKRELIALSFAVLFLYTGFIWGILPIKVGVSWEYHLGGFIVGFIFAVLFRKYTFVTPTQTYDVENEAADDAVDDEIVIDNTNCTDSTIEYTYTYRSRTE